MNLDRLLRTAELLLLDDKGILAMDESNPTCNARFSKLGIPQTEGSRRAYRELLVTTPGLAECVSGAILFDETFDQLKKDRTRFVDALADAGVLPGIKVDCGTEILAGHPGETVTWGLDGLRERLGHYSSRGARFAKWRAAMVIGNGHPSRGCIAANAHALARYASLCQEVGLLPIVEPEVLMDGDHTLGRCAEVMEVVLRSVFAELIEQRVSLEALILKPSMALPGVSCPEQPSVEVVAQTTLTSLLRTVPAAVPGIAFLSGGQSPELASARLNAMNLALRSRAPWALTFSFSRAVQEPALKIWQGKAIHTSSAQQALLHRLSCNRAARRGEYTSAMEEHGGQGLRTPREAKAS